MASLSQAQEQLLHAAQLQGRAWKAGEEQLPGNQGGQFRLGDLAGAKIDIQSLFAAQSGLFSDDLRGLGEVDASVGELPL